MTITERILVGFAACMAAGMVFIAFRMWLEATSTEEVKRKRALRRVNS